ncbi:hypothetical protein [Feifania hominis]|uniref:Uncharacterized protein n=1 Tax=Feifania hominis TaxID=2763660 RepID=A0A926DH23_9FIRM|nr:hypothetical protein [Feifania hominis]MBC8536925.1 hypothetical protein [Feifania hominis]
MRRKTILLILLALLAISLCLLAVSGSLLGRRPFSRLTADKIRGVHLTLQPPEWSTELTEPADLETLAALLQKLRVYRESNGGQHYAGQLVTYTLTLQDGTVHTIGAFTPFLFIDEVCYEAEYAPCEKIVSFGSSFLP